MAGRVNYALAAVVGKGRGVTSASRARRGVWARGKGDFQA